MCFGVREGACENLDDLFKITQLGMTEPEMKSRPLTQYPRTMSLCGSLG